MHTIVFLCLFQELKINIEDPAATALDTIITSTNRLQNPRALFQ